MAKKDFSSHYIRPPKKPSLGAVARMNPRGMAKARTASKMRMATGKR